MGGVSLERAVAVDAHQLDGVVARGGHYGVRQAAHLKDVNVQWAAEGQHGVVGDLVGRAGLKRAVAVDAHQLDAAFSARGDGGVRRAAHLKGGDGRGAAEPQAGGVVQLVDRPERMVAGVHLEQLDAAVLERGDNGVRAAAHLKGVDANGLVKLQRAAVLDPVYSLERAVLVDPQQLDAALAVRGDDGVRAAARAYDVDPDGAGKLPASGVGDAGGRRLERAVLVDPQQLDALAVRGHGGVRVVPRLDDRRALGRSEPDIRVVGQMAGRGEHG